jgi:hypothetical protein
VVLMVRFEVWSEVPVATRGFTLQCAAAPAGKGVAAEIESATEVVPPPPMKLPVTR